MRYVFLLMLILVSASVFAKPRPARQGICGTVREVRGNRMPGPGRTLPAGQPVVREILIYPALTLDQVTTSDEGFITDTKGLQPVRTLKSDQDGRFCVYKLPVGVYSVLTREAKGLYSNLSDGQSRINPVVVSRRKITAIALEISHSAAF
jgi:hypothetical protein